MRIAINALSAKIGGGVTYLQNIVPRLVKLDTGNEYYLFVSNEGYAKLAASIGSVEGRIRLIKTPSHGMISRMLIEQLLLPYLVLKNRIDLLYCPANIVSFLAPCKKLLWVQNIDPFVAVESDSRLSRLKIKLLGFFTYWSMRFASVVIFSTDFSRKLAADKTGIGPGRARQIFLGTGLENFKAQRDGHSFHSGYILSVSNISRRKNYETLIRAYVALKPELREKFKLVLVGAVSDAYRKELLSLCREACWDKIVFTGELSGPELYNSYRQASLFVLPSLVESFSLPAVEAMAAGLPVIASNATCLPEIIGDAGILFDPRDHNDLAKKIETVLADQELYSRLSRKSKERAKIFSWDKTARETLAVINEMEGKS